MNKYKYYKEHEPLKVIDFEFRPDFNKSMGTKLISRLPRSGSIMLFGCSSDCACTLGLLVEGDNYTGQEIRGGDLNVIRINRKIPRILGYCSKCYSSIIEGKEGIDGYCSKDNCRKGLNV